MRRFNALWYALMAFMTITAGLSCGKSEPPYQQLAAMDSGTSHPPAELVVEFQTVLDNLSLKCPSQSQTEIRDEILQGQKILLKVMGKNVKLIKIAQVIDKTIPDGTTIEKCNKMNTSLL